MANIQTIKGIIFDVDQTLTSEVSWTKFTRILGADPKVHQDIYQRFKEGKLSYPDAKTQLIALWKATGRADLATVKKIFAGFDFNPYTEEIISYLKEKGYKLCLISGAIDTYIETVALRLNIKDWYASTKLYFDSQGEILDFDYTLGRGEEKLAFFADYCVRNGLKPAECAAVGDGDTDMPIFEKVALPILFIAPETSVDQKQQIERHIFKLTDLKKYL